MMLKCECMGVVIRLGWVVVFISVKCGSGSLMVWVVGFCFSMMLSLKFFIVG